MNERPTPETDEAIIGDGFPMPVVYADFSRQLERERDEIKKIAASAINTNVRLFDLVRYSRASLHKDELITDEEYAWLCGGAEMANSPKGGSPSPRRLEDYDGLREQLAAMREAIKDSCAVLQSVPAEYDPRFFRAGKWTEAALSKLQPFLMP